MAYVGDSAKGDLLASNGTDRHNLSVGANGTLLAADSSQSLGLRWEDTLIIDFANLRAGIGTTTPDRQLEIVNAADPQLRLTDTEGVRYTDFQHYDAGGFFEGATVLPSINAMGYYAVNLFGTTPSAGSYCFFYDSAGDYMDAPRDLDHNLRMTVTAGHEIEMNVAFGFGLHVQGSRCLSYLPFEFIIPSAAGAAVNYPLVVKSYYTGGNPSAGFGSGINWQLEGTGDVYETVGVWDTKWLDVTAGSRDSASDFQVLSASNPYHIMRVDGQNQCVSIDAHAPTSPAILLYCNGGAVFNEQSADVDFRVESNTDANCLFVDGGADFVGIGTNAPGAKLDVRGGAIFNEDAASVDFRVESTGRTHMLYVDGSSDMVCIGTSLVPASTVLNVNGNAQLTSGFLRVGANPGAGVLGYVTYGNTITAPAGGTPATLGNTGGAGDPATAAQNGWLKIYDGTNVAYIPVCR